MFIIISRHFIPKGFSAITFYPFIFVKNKNIKNDIVVINHEKIHVKQQIELFIIIFFVWYVIEFIYLFFRYKNFKKAYKNIVFEREAYSNEKDEKYIGKRKIFSFYNYY